MKLDPYFRGICAIAMWASSLTAALAPTHSAHANTADIVQTPERILDEARTVYLGNLKRRENDKPPLKWNKQLTKAARWFSWDSVENEPAGFCDHKDSQGHWPDWRAQQFGYKGSAGAENAYCGMLDPQAAIDGWLDSAGHRTNLLNADYQEVGLGYYFNGTRGYVTQDFGTDPDFTPLIISDEAITTTSTQVSLYLHNRASSSYGLGPTTEMRISNDLNFEALSWEPYTTTKKWTLAAGSGWRTVYVQTRDAMNRMAIVSDIIYLGEQVALAELGDKMMSSTQDSVVLSDLASQNGYDRVQFAPGWAMDDTVNPQLSYGTGGPEQDDKAWNKTTYCLKSDTSQASARIWTTDFVADVPMQAYFRLRTSDNSAVGEVARLQVTAGTNTSAALVLKGADFSAANTYQEFRLPFTYHKSGNQVFLMFEFWRSSSAEICLDAVSIFPDPTPMSTQMTVTLPDGNYRGQMLWGRYANQTGQFTEIKTFNPVVTAATALPPVPPTFTVKSQIFLAGVSK